MITGEMGNFVWRLRTYGVHIIIPAGRKEREKIAPKLGGNDSKKLANLFSEFKERTGVRNFSFALSGKKRPREWFKKGQPLTAVINFDRISAVDDIKVALIALAELAKKTKEIEEEPEVEKAEKVGTTLPLETIAKELLVSPSGIKPPEVKEKKEAVLSADDILVEIGERVKVFLPGTRELGVRYEMEEGLLVLLRPKTNRKSLNIWLLKGKEPPEIQIGWCKYRLKETTIVQLGDEGEFIGDRFVSKEIAGAEFPLTTGREGEKIINLTVIKRNKTWDEFIAG